MPSPSELDSLDDESLASRVRDSSDVDAFAELFKRYENYVLSICRDLVEPEADDSAAEAWKHVHEGVGQFTGGSFKAWIGALTRHLCLNKLGRAYRRHESPEDTDTFATAHRNPEQLAVSAETEQRFWKVLKQLEGSSPRQALVIRLRLEGYPRREIARTLHVSEQQVKADFQNGTKRFERIWRKEFGNWP